MIGLPTNIIPVILNGDVIQCLENIPKGSINCVITSPPYYGQRDYNVEGQIGIEKTPEEYIKKMVEVADKLLEVLDDNGSYFLNIGDKYIGKKLQMIPYRVAIEMQKRGWVLRNIISWYKPNHMPSSIKDRLSNTYEAVFFFVKDTGKYYSQDYFCDIDEIREEHVTEEVKKLNLPETFEIKDYNKIHKKYKEQKKMNKYSGKFNGHKKNLGASPGARNSLLNGFDELYSLQRKYHIDNQKETEIIEYLREARKKVNMSTKEIDKKFGYRDTAGHWFRLDPGRSLPKPGDWDKLKNILKLDGRYDKIMKELHYVLQTVKHHPKGKNPGDVWSIKTDKLKEAHFAIFPKELPRRIMKAFCPREGIVLDPFAGSGTTGAVARELGIRSILIELNKDYNDVMRKRCGEINITEID